MRNQPQVKLNSQLTQTVLRTFDFEVSNKKYVIPQSTVSSHVFQLITFLMLIIFSGMNDVISLKKEKAKPNSK